METGTTGAANELNVCFASEPETMDPSMNRTVDGNVMITHLFEGLYKWVDSDPSGDGRNGATAVLEPGMAAEEPLSLRMRTVPIPTPSSCVRMPSGLTASP